MKKKKQKTKTTTNTPLLQNRKIENNNSAFSLPHNANTGNSAICSHGMYSESAGGGKDTSLFFIKGPCFTLSFWKEEWAKQTLFMTMCFFPCFALCFFLLLFFFLFFVCVTNALTTSCGLLLESPKCLRAPWKNKTVLKHCWKQPLPDLHVCSLLPPMISWYLC